MNKAIITVVARTPSASSPVCVPFGHHVNVLDISQTIIDGFFNMMMIVVTATPTTNSAPWSTTSTSSAIGVRIRCQREIFTKMHRVSPSTTRIARRT